MQDMQTVQTYSPRRVADMLGVNQVTVWRWCRDGKVKSFRRPSGQTRIPQEEVNRLLESQQVAPKE